MEKDASSGSYTISDFSKDRRYLSAPVVITEASGYLLEDAQATPFARTWNNPYGTGSTYVDSTSTKYRRRWNLNDRKETKQDSTGIVTYEFTGGVDYNREYYIEWGDKGDDGYYDPTFHITNNDNALTNVIVEYEEWDASGYYTVEHLNLNPLHTANTVGKFAIIRETLPTSHDVSLEVMNPYIIGPSGVTSVSATVIDQHGTPIQGEVVAFSMEPYKAATPTLFGTLGASEMTTSFDGSCAVTYTAPGTLTSLLGSLAAGVHIKGTINSGEVGETSDTVKIELGNTSS